MHLTGEKHRTFSVLMTLFFMQKYVTFSLFIPYFGKNMPSFYLKLSVCRVLLYVRPLMRSPSLGEMPFGGAVLHKVRPYSGGNPTAAIQPYA